MRPQDVSDFNKWVALELYRLAKLTIFRFRGNLDTLSSNIKFPPVIRAPETTIFIATKPQ